MHTKKLIVAVFITAIAWELLQSSACSAQNQPGGQGTREAESTTAVRQQELEIELRGGKNFIPTRVYSAEEDAAVLKLFQGLRVADVCDALDQIGLRNACVMSSDIQPA